jgi:hypothetical protein
LYAHGRLRTLAQGVHEFIVVGALDQRHHALYGKLAAGDGRGAVHVLYRAQREPDVVHVLPHRDAVAEDVEDEEEGGAFDVEAVVGEATHEVVGLHGGVDAEEHLACRLDAVPARLEDPGGAVAELARGDLDGLGAVRNREAVVLLPERVEDEERAEDEDQDVVPPVAEEDEVDAVRARGEGFVGAELEVCREGGAELVEVRFDATRNLPEVEEGALLAAIEPARGTGVDAREFNQVEEEGLIFRVGNGDVLVAD